MSQLKTAQALGAQIENMPAGNYVNGEQGVISTGSTLSHGTSHACKDKWRTRANAKDLVVVRKVMY